MSPLLLPLSYRPLILFNCLNCMEVAIVIFSIDNALDDIISNVDFCDLFSFLKRVRRLN